MVSDNNYWSNLMGTDDMAANYMDSYGEGPGCETREIIGSFINDGESVLDVGCGPGWNLDHFIKHGPQVGDYLGLDLSERFIRIANKRHSHTEFFKLGDCRDLKQRNGSFDVVILQDVLEHTNGYEKPVKEALRVAKRRVIISFWRMDRIRENKINDDTARGDDGYGAEYNQNDWEVYLNSLPFPWMDTESSPRANRKHLFYIINKEPWK